MNLPRRLLLAASAFVQLATFAAEPDLVLKVWPGLPPGDKPNLGEEKMEAGKMIRGVVTTPTLAVYRPAREKDTGAAVLIAPGGGFYQLSMGHEGSDVATWLNSIGVTGIVLKYRIPTRDGMERSLPMTQDAQRAMSIVRSKAVEWGLDPKRIGICGFSAGGEVAVNLLSNADKRLYEVIDDFDQVEMRANFSLLIYTGGVLKRGAEPPSLNDNIVFTKDTPPTFLSVSHDDRGVEQTVLLYLALKRAGAPCEMHVWSEGGHGYGIRPSNFPHSTWPARAAEWMGVRGLFKSAAAGVISAETKAAK